MYSGNFPGLMLCGAFALSPSMPNSILLYSLPPDFASWLSGYLYINTGKSISKGIDNESGNGRRK